MQKARAYNWMFTHFVDELPDKDVLDEHGFIYNHPTAKLVFLVCQLEKAPSTGRIHIQGYAEFAEKYSMKQLKEDFGNSKIHFEPRKGSQQQAIDYCTKRETRLYDDIEPYYYGKRKAPGNRSDLDSMVDAIEDGMTTLEILRIFRGNALRHINMIRQGVETFNALNQVDMVVMDNRNRPDYINEWRRVRGLDPLENTIDTNTRQICLEVGGNTGHAHLDDDEDFQFECPNCKEKFKTRNAYDMHGYFGKC